MIQRAEAGDSGGVEMDRTATIRALATLRAARATRSKEGAGGESPALARSQAPRSGPGGSLPAPDLPGQHTPSVRVPLGHTQSAIKGEGLTLAEVAEHIRRDIRAALQRGELPEATYTVRTETYPMGQSVNVLVSGLPFDVINTEAFHVPPGARRMDFDSSRGLNRFTPAALDVERKVSALVDAYQWRGFEPGTDYYAERFAEHVRVVEDESEWKRVEATKLAAARQAETGDGVPQDVSRLPATEVAPTRARSRLPKAGPMRSPARFAVLPESELRLVLVEGLTRLAKPSSLSALRRALPRPFQWPPKDLERILHELAAEGLVLEEPASGKARTARYGIGPPPPAPSVPAKGHEADPAIGPPDPASAMKAVANELLSLEAQLGVPVGALYTALGRELAEALPATAAEDDAAVLAAVEQHAARQPRGALLFLPDVRALCSLPKARFDRAAMRLSKARRVILHHHDFPKGLSEEKRRQLVEDENGVHYIGIAIPGGP